jgi:hypothetical protein
MFKQLFDTVDGVSYPPGTYVAITPEPPDHGQLVVREEYMGPHRVLWTCEHDDGDPTGAWASGCAGREIGRDRMLSPIALEH